MTRTRYEAFRIFRISKQINVVGTGECILFWNYQCAYIS